MGILFLLVLYPKFCMILAVLFVHLSCILHVCATQKVTFCQEALAMVPKSTFYKL